MASVPALKQAISETIMQLSEIKRDLARDTQATIPKYSMDDLTCDRAVYQQGMYPFYYYSWDHWTASRPWTAISNIDI